MAMRSKQTLPKILFIACVVVVFQHPDVAVARLPVSQSRSIEAKVGAGTTRLVEAKHFEEFNDRVDALSHFESSTAEQQSVLVGSAVAGLLSASADSGPAGGSASASSLFSMTFDLAEEERWHLHAEGVWYRQDGRVGARLSISNATATLLEFSPLSDPPLDTQLALAPGRYTIEASAYAFPFGRVTSASSMLAFSFQPVSEASCVELALIGLLCVTCCRLSAQFRTIVSGAQSELSQVGRTSTHGSCRWTLPRRRALRIFGDRYSASFRVQSVLLDSGE